jgi:hypothetical protein
MTEDKKRKIHPIAEKALEMAIPGIEPIEFDDYAVEQIQDLLKQRFGKPDLIDAVIDLVNLAASLDKQGCHSAAIKIITAACYASDDLKKKSRFV